MMRGMFGGRGGPCGPGGPGGHHGPRHGSGGRGGFGRRHGSGEREGRDGSPFQFDQEAFATQMKEFGENMKKQFDGENGQMDP